MLNTICLPIVTKGKVIIHLTAPDLSDSAALMHPLSGMSQFSFVVLARAKVLLKHSVFLLIDAVTLLVHPLFHDLFGLLLLIV